MGMNSWIQMRIGLNSNENVWLDSDDNKGFDSDENEGGF